MSLNILIADDHPIFLKGLKEVIETDTDLKVVAESPNGQEALISFQTLKIDVAILDIDMPRMNGLDAAEQMLRLKPEFPIIILTMHKEKAPFMRSLEIGIQGYVLKENAVSDVVNAIYKVHQGNSYLSPEMSSYLFKRNNASSKQSKVDVLSLLTPTEKQILKMVAEYKSSKEIADELFISEKTVFNHRMNISKKLNLTGKNSLLRFAVEHIGQ
jgi:two-component system, NarL family, response regulator DegU